MDEKSEFQRELEQLINRHNQEGISETPDYILATYLNACLCAYNVAIQARERWHGRVISSPVGVGGGGDRA